MPTYEHTLYNLRKTLHSLDDQYVQEKLADEVLDAFQEQLVDIATKVQDDETLGDLRGVIWEAQAFIFIIKHQNAEAIEQLETVQHISGRDYEFISQVVLDFVLQVQSEKKMSNTLMGWQVLLIADGLCFLAILLNNINIDGSILLSLASITTLFAIARGITNIAKKRKMSQLGILMLWLGILLLLFLLPAAAFPDR